MQAQAGTLEIFAVAVYLPVIVAIFVGLLSKASTEEHLDKWFAGLGSGPKP